jgi:Fe-S-cluster containining protein
MRFTIDMTELHNKRQGECDKCGACCRTFPVLVSIGDVTREPRIAEYSLRLPEWQRTEEWEYQLHPLPFLEACPFLSEASMCKAYQTRPDPCRRFQAGTEHCNEARRRVGLGPLLPLPSLDSPDPG